ncbi:uncharacterized protein SRS1_11791 [Sporisorium reilianum f. sp. reilianum]|uniref:Methylosome subunit pICln n=1 Tax=Sporisorium reilianum f. sp. reilianum TaxID=72559 RepID=A0A2N8U6V3_9BASI|nr:uncharacterized protein SRS1_11791 [Sporisorium reilianum f. sp. reilianum]
MEEISAPPAYATADQLAQLQTSTPQSFDNIASQLHLHLAQSTIYVSPSPSSRPPCFEQLAGTSNGAAHHGDDDDDDDNDEVGAEVFQASGELWLTERELSFLAPKTGTGFRLGYPNVALHAVARTPPSFLSTSNGSSQGFHGCLYCQLDLSPNAAAAEMGVDGDDDNGEFVEMYICTPDGASLDQLFEALSHCASLHPSGPVDDDGGHPFSGFAPFGTSGSGTQLGDGMDQDDQDDEGAFDDADGDDDAELSETGRVRAEFQTPDSRYRPY